jgi:TonB-dependent SusC/RagA subfamily outer membrane receptor
MKYILIIIISVCFSVGLNAQSKTVTGKVTTFKTIPVLKVKIQVKSNNQAFFSDSLGAFSVTCQTEDMLTVSAEGFRTEKIRIRKKIKYALINLKLEETEDAKEVAIGYGHVKDKDKLYAMVSQNDASLNYTRYRTIYEALVGNFNGLQVIDGDVIVRGSNSMDRSAPALLIVDGREVSKDLFGNIATSEISNITVLKDASASVYGVQGGNGVVIVETKRGGK